jgi:hypothetical protein
LVQKHLHHIVGMRCKKSFHKVPRFHKKCFLEFCEKSSENNRNFVKILCKILGIL